MRESLREKYVFRCTLFSFGGPERVVTLSYNLLLHSKRKSSVARNFNAYTIIAVSFLVFLAGCSPDKAAEKVPEDLGKVSIDKYSNISAKLDFERGTASLPLDPYLVNQNEAFFNKMMQAMSVFVESCVVEQGLSYNQENVNWSQIPPRENRLFGAWSVTLAGQFGFGIDPNSGPPKTFPDQPDPAAAEAANACYEKKNTRFLEVGEFAQAPQLDAAISGYAFQQTIDHPDGKAAIARRSDCVKQRGFSLAEDGYLDESYDGQSAEQQVAAATAFAECQVSTGAIQQLFDLYARYQAAYIDKYEAQLNALVKERQKFEAELDKIIEGGK